MRGRIESILNNDIQVVLKSPELSLSLIYCYSQMYENGEHVRACERSQRMYYNKLKINGMAKIAEYEQIKNRTLVPAFKGRRYVPKAAKHISSESLTDKDAIDMLKRKFLTVKDFKKLPDGYKQRQGKKENKEID